MPLSRPPRLPARLVSRNSRDPKDLLKKRGADLIRKISDKDRYAIFLEPVDLQAVPGYADTIKRPMDLSTAQTNLQLGVYRTPAELRDDLDLIWSNCCTFNADDSIYFKEAVRLRALAARYYDDLCRLLIKDGVASSLGLAPTRHNPPSTARAAQKRLPRHRASSRRSDPDSRQNTPSAPPSTNSLEQDQDSHSQSASGSSPNVSTFRDVQLRRARSHHDTAVTAAATASLEAKHAAKNAGLSVEKPTFTKQLYNGPGNVLQKRPISEPAHLDPRKHRIISNPRLRDSLTEVPLAWKRIGRWHGSVRQNSKFLSSERAEEVRLGRQYQKFVEKAAPVARRILATVLDPNVVHEHDCSEINQYMKNTDLSANKKDLKNVGAAGINGKITRRQDKRQNGKLDAMDVDIGAGSKRSSGGATETKSSKRRRTNSERLPERPYKYCEREYGLELRDIVGPERFPNFPSQRVDQLAQSSRGPPDKKSIYRLRALLKSKNVDPAFINRIIATDCDSDAKDGAGNTEAEIQAHRKNLSNLLSSNHAIMMNVLRLRALRECADEALHETLEEYEREAVERLAEGISLAVRSLPPRVVVHPQDATDTALVLAKSIAGGEPETDTNS